MATSGGREALNWRRNLYLMIFIQGIVTSSFQLVNPVLPLFVGELGVTDPAALARWAGLLPGINALFTAVFSPLWGGLADRYGRKPMVVRTTASVALFSGLTALVVSPYQILALRILMGCFSGFSAAALALIASNTPREHLGFALGWLQTGQTVGMVVGPFLGGLLADIVSYRGVFVVASVMAALGGLLTVLGIKEQFQKPEPPVRNPRSGGQIIGRRQFTSALTRHWQRLKSWPTNIWVLFVVILLSQFATRSVEPIVPLYVQAMAGSATESVASLSGLVVGIMGVAQVMAVAYLGRRMVLFGYKKVIWVCLVGAALTYVPQALVSNVWHLAALRFIQGLFLGGLLPAANTLIGYQVSPEQRGRVYGFTSSAFFLGNFAGPLFGGLLAAWLGISAVFYASAGLVLINALWVTREVQEPARVLSPK
ncbi:MAG: MFS transporter [Clostridia bacterium]|nr:MFS transporter [Clostridia bacterium]